MPGDRRERQYVDIAADRHPARSYSPSLLPAFDIAIPERKLKARLSGFRVP